VGRPTYRSAAQLATVTSVASVAKSRTESDTSAASVDRGDECFGRCVAAELLEALARERPRRHRRTEAPRVAERADGVVEAAERREDPGTLERDASAPYRAVRVE